jgi:exodeoxyribonuclease VII small subunit
LVSSSGAESTGESPHPRNPVTNPTDTAEPTTPTNLASNPAIDELGFDQALAELQKTVAELEAGGLPLERSLALYERGVALHERCARLLTDAELRLKQLVSQAGGTVAAVELATQEAADSD